MEEKKDIYILAIESSCDETAAAVVKNGREVLSNVISSQIDRIRYTAALCRRLHPESMSKILTVSLKRHWRTRT